MVQVVLKGLFISINWVPHGGGGGGGGVSGQLANTCARPHGIGRQGKDKASNTVRSRKQWLSHSRAPSDTSLFAENCFGTEMAAVPGDSR